MNWDDKYLKYISDSYTKQLLKNESWVMDRGSTYEMMQFNKDKEMRVIINTTVASPNVTVEVIAERTMSKKYSQTGTSYKTTFQSSFTHVFNQTNSDVVPDYDAMNIFMTNFILITEKDYEQKTLYLLKDFRGI